MSTEDDPRVRYGLSCPVNGDVQICEDTDYRFIGCCVSGACSRALDGNCSGDALFPASFSASKYSGFLPQSCIEPYDERNWYTCMDATPPFIGCCKNNPCNGGCLEGNLIPARLSDIEENAAQFLSPSAAESSSTTPNPAATQTVTSSPSPTETEAGTSSPTHSTGLIVGLSMAGVVILLAVLGIYLWRRRREETRKKRECPDSDGGGADDQPGMATTPGLVKETLSNTPATINSSPHANQGIFAHQKSRSPALSSPRTPGSGSWAPSDVHSGHVSQLSDLSSSDWMQMHDRTAPARFQPVQELEGSEVARPPHRNSGDPYRTYGGYQQVGQQ
ncbi:hypothetical protein F5X99DRAFT_377831 [Biscogniauxia marginata]|nr:hypothetical protein F5X99DRAFT_377831 [Biscogniauxia marginata]